MFVAACDRFVTHFVAAPSDAIVDALSAELREIGRHVNKVTGKLEQRPAQFYVVEMHEMTVKAALLRFPVSCRAAPLGSDVREWKECLTVRTCCGLDSWSS
jgi:hypothetical protein